MTKRETLIVAAVIYTISGVAGAISYAVTESMFVVLVTVCLVMPMSVEPAFWVLDAGSPPASDDRG